MAKYIYKLDTIEAWFRQLVSGCVIDEVIFFFYNHKLQDVEPICFYTKGQLISKANFECSFEPKNERKYFCISALASKMGQIIKIMGHYHAN